MHFLISSLFLSCTKKPNIASDIVTPQATLSSMTSKMCLTESNLCHDTAWLFWKGYAKPSKVNAEGDWDSSTRFGQLSPKWMFGIKASGVAVTQGQKTPWVPVLSYSADLTGLQIAQKMFAELCDSGHHKSCVSQGYMLMDKDQEKAKTLFQSACSEQIGIGCHALAQILKDDSEKALTHLEMGARIKDPNSSAGLAFVLLASENADIQKEYIQELLQESCLSKHKPEVFMGYDGFEIQVGRWQFLNNQAKACFALGENNQDAEESKKLMEMSCRMEYPAACQSLCIDGNGESCFDLGALHHNGSGVEQSTEKKMMYFQKACELGYKPGCMPTE